LIGFTVGVALHSIGFTHHLQGLAAVGDKELRELGKAAAGLTTVGI